VVQAAATGTDSWATPATTPVGALTRSESALVFAGYAALALAVGTVLLYRRDPD
jgi:hypothetical protein